MRGASTRSFCDSGAAVGGCMEEGMNKAIPIRRSRAGRTAPAPAAGRWSDGLVAGVRAVVAPPRQLWLAGLGGIALAVRGTRAAWAHLVTEGAATEGRLLRLRTGASGD
jgi:hypothetical protein